MDKQELENKYRIFKEVQAFFHSIGKQTSDEQISTQFDLLSDEAQETVRELTARQNARRNK